LVSNYESIEELLNGKDDSQVLFELLSCGTKPLNALAFLSVKNHTDKRERDELKAKFDYEEAEGYVVGAFETATAALASSYMMAVTRGSLPGSSVQSTQNPLPSFVLSMFKHVSPKTEGDLLSLTMDFDPKHVDLSTMFEESNLSDWPEEIANRMNLGVAGHKLVKACHMLSTKFITTKSKGLELCERLAELGQEADGGFYPKLHPAMNRIKDAYPKFYTYGLKALFNSLEGSKDNKYLLLKQVGAFNSDKLIIKRELENVTDGYMGWDLDVLFSLIGKPVKFSSYDPSRIVRKAPIVHGDFEYMEVKSREATVEETVEVTEKAVPLGEVKATQEKSDAEKEGKVVSPVKAKSTKDKKGLKQRFLEGSGSK